MAYTQRELVEAQDRLSEIYGVYSRSERIAMAEAFGYGGSDDSKLRSLRRISTGSLGRRQTAEISRFFRPFITEANPEAWTGRLPPFRLSSPYTIQSYVMYVMEEQSEFIESQLLTIDGNLNLNRDDLGIPASKAVASTDLAELFALYNRLARVKVTEQRYTKAIAFTDEGAEQLVDLFEGRIEVPRVNREFGVYLVSVFPPKSGTAMQTKTFQRGIPKAKQETIVRSINRRYSALSRSGGRLA
jgi:hypothetical protein